jgi:hypothetical protein
MSLIRPLATPAAPVPSPQPDMLTDAPAGWLTRLVGLFTTLIRRA